MRYYAFVSYNSADEKWAKWLQHSLEYYHVPSALCKEYSNLPKKIRPVFWYKQDLSGTKLKDALSKELENSKFLIVICSPDSAKSEWVNDEVLSFIKQGKGDKIIPFIVGGVPHAKNTNEECFPPALLGLKRDEEIRGIDVIRKEGKWHALVDVIATMFGIRFDELWERHKKRRRRIVFLSILSLLAVLAVCVAWRVSVKKELITQAKFIAAEAEKLAKEGDWYMCIKLLNYVGRNNKYSLKNAYFEHAIRTLDCNYKFPERRFIHDGRVNSVVFSPDGKYVVTASSDETSKIWSVESGERLQDLWHDDRVNSVVFSPDGKYVVTASSDNTSKIWSAETGECFHTLSHDKSVNSAVFSPDSRYVVTASRDNTSKIWLAETGECLHTLSHDEVVYSAVFSPDGRYVVTASSDYKSKFIVRIWLVRRGNCVRTMYYDHYIESVSFGPDGRYVVTCSGDKAQLWSVTNGNCIVIMNHSDRVGDDIAIDSTGRYIVTCCDNVAYLWPVSLDIIYKLYEMVDVVFSSNEKYILGYDEIGRAKLWDIEHDRYLTNINNELKVYSEFSSDGKYIVTSNYGIKFKLWSIENDSCISTINNGDYVRDSKFSPDGRHIVTLCDNDDEIINLWTIGNGRLIKIYHKNGIDNTVFSPDGN